jgi:hypothetical protein
VRATVEFREASGHVLRGERKREGWVYAVLVARAFRLEGQEGQDPGSFGAWSPVSFEATSGTTGV